MLWLLINGLFMHLFFFSAISEYIAGRFEFTRSIVDKRDVLLVD